MPLIAWFGANTDVDVARTQRLRDMPNSHDALAGTLLSIFELETDLPQEATAAQPLIYMGHAI